MARMIITVFAQSAPNRWPIRILEVRETIIDPATWIVEEYEEDGGWDYTDNGNGYEATCYEDARDYYEKRRVELATTPNWEAQAQYDEEHGTDNGYDPQIEAWKREY